MSNKHNALTVVLSDDVGEETAAAIIEAIMMIKYVIAATPNVVDLATYSAQMRVRREIGTKLMDVLYPRNDNSN